MSVADLLDWIDRSFSCGTLTMERGANTRSFHFDSGYVTNVSSDDPSEHLGRLLRKRQLVPEEALEDAFRVQADTGVLLGKILLMVGALDEDQLRETLEGKFAESVSDAVAWSEGTFVFEPDATSMSVSEYEVSVNLRRAIDVGIERLAAWERIRGHFREDDTQFWMKDRTAAGESSAQLLDLLEAGRSAGELLLDLPFTRFEVMSALADLIEAGVIGVDRRERQRSSESDLSIEQLAQAVRGRAAGGDRSGALAMVERAVESDPENETILALKGEIERAVFAELSRSLLTSFRVPKLLKTHQELESIDMNQTERYLTGRIDGRWDLLSLMRISPMREVEALRAFKRLADRGIISL